MATVPQGKSLAGPSTCSCARLRRLTRRITQYYDQALKPSGLKVTQYSILAHVAQESGESLTDLAERLDMDRTTLTRNLRPLQKSGLVEPTAGADGRSRNVRLTDAGARCLAETAPLWRAAERGFREMVGEDDAALLRNLASSALVRLSGE